MGRDNKRKPRVPEKQSLLVNEFSPRTSKQQELVGLIQDKEIIIAKGIAGSGKTYVSLAVALSLLGEQYKRIIIVKSVTTLPQEEIGFLKGSQNEKMEPFMMSFTWNIDKLCGENSAKSLMEKNLVQVLPLAFIRGISIDNSIVIIDETQNLTLHAFKTMMTRIGENSKYIFLGDVEQVDRKNKNESCLNKVLELFKDVPEIGTIEFVDEDCVRNPLIPKILSILRENNI